jgi:hypothetical protein
MPDCSIVIKTPIDTISIGFNVQFSIGEWRLCGHVEKISYSISCSDSGLDNTTTTLMLSRVCMVKQDNNLDFIPDDVVGSLHIAPKWFPAGENVTSNIDYSQIGKRV